MVNFLFVTIERFSLSLTVETLYKRKSQICQIRRFLKGVGHFERKFQTEGDVIRQPLLQARVIALSCGIKNYAVHCLVLSQSTRVTDGRTDRQNYDS